MREQMGNAIAFAVLLCLFCKTKAGTSYENDVKKSKRGYFGELNEYGPATHVSSAVLQLEHEPHIEISDPNDVLHKSFDGGTYKEPKIWNSIAFGWQPVHKIVDESNDEYLHQTGLEENTFSHGSTNEYLPRSGLHTQIISSSGHGTSELNDKIDLANAVDLNGKHYIKSYG